MHVMPFAEAHGSPTGGGRLVKPGLKATNFLQHRTDLASLAAFRCFRLVHPCLLWSEKKRGVLCLLFIRPVCVTAREHSVRFCSNVPDREHAVALPAQKYLPAILHFGWRAEHLGGELFDVEAGP